jgi:GNAT superfamily N-acetyltransferase
MSSDLIVRIAGEGDLGVVTSLRIASAAGNEQGDHAGFERHVAEWLAGEGDRRTIWLAELAGESVGMATLFEYRRMPRPGRLDSRWGYVGHMFVREDHRNKGIGSALLNALIDAASERGYARLTVSPTDRSVPFYRRAGFLDADGAPGDLLLIRPGGVS